MRDSPLKRALLRGYFSALEVRGAVRGAWGAPRFPAAGLDYDAYWQARGAPSHHRRHELIGAALGAGQTVLDVGCGPAPFLHYLRQAHGIEGHGLDVSDVAIARVRAAGFQGYVGTLAAFRRDHPGRVFDHVVLSEVIEHVADAEALLADAWAITARSLWITFPNIAYLPHRLRLLAGRFPVQWVVHPGEHVRFWSLPDFRDWLAAQGLRAADYRASSGITVLGLSRLWPNLLANQIVVRINRGSA